MASPIEHTWPLDPVEVWPPDDTEESIMGTDLHQMTIMNLRWGLNEVAGQVQGQAPTAPWQTLSQTMITGFARPNGSRYRTFPDLFVYPRPIARERGSLSLLTDGPPVLIVEVLSEATYDSDLDLAAGKGYSYARAGVAEYLALDPMGVILPDGGQGWRLVDGAYVPWVRDEAGRWQSHRIEAAIGLEGVLAAVYARSGVRQLREGEVTRELRHERARVEEQQEQLARRDAELAQLRQTIEELRRVSGH